MSCPPASHTGCTPDDMQVWLRNTTCAQDGYTATEVTILGPSPRDIYNIDVQDSSQQSIYSSGDLTWPNVIINGIGINLLLTNNDVYKVVVTRTSPTPTMLGVYQFHAPYCNPVPS